MTYKNPIPLGVGVVREEEYQKVHGDEHSNPLLIHGLPKEILEMFDIKIDNL